MIIYADLMVTKDENFKIKLHQAVNLTAAGTVGGSFWGDADPDDIPQPAVGCAVGASAGALSGKLSDIGVNEKEVVCIAMFI